MSVRSVELAGFEVQVSDEPVEVTPDSGDHPAALWTRQVVAGGNIRAVVRNIDRTTSFDDVHRIAERVADELGIGAADVAFTVADA